MIFKQIGKKGMVEKPVIVFDRLDSSGERFWTPMIGLLNQWCYDGEFIVVQELEEIIPTIKKMMAV